MIFKNDIYIIQFDMFEEITYPYTRKIHRRQSHSPSI